MNATTSNASILLYLLLAAPLVTSLLAFGCARSRQQILGTVTAINIAGSCALLLLSLGLVAIVGAEGHMLAAKKWLYLDALSAIFLLVLGILGFITGLYSHGYMKQELAHGKITVPTLCHYYGFFHLFIFTILVVITTNNLIIMWAGVEATTLASAFLVAIQGQKSSLEAAWKYIIICTVGVAFGLYGTVLVYSNAATLMGPLGLDPGNAIFWTEVLGHASGLDQTLMYIAFTFVLVGFGTKAGLFPMHAWLPDAHCEAPSPVSALLSAVLLKCAVLVILRYYIIVNRSIGSEITQNMLLFFGMITVVGASCFIVIQQSRKNRYANGHDLKRLLAYSSLEHMGIVAVGLGFGGPLGVFASLMHIINHSLAKGLIFCVSGNVLLKYGTRDLRSVLGMLKLMPLSAVLLAAGALALSGVPPFSIFISEVMVVMAGVSAEHTVLAVVFSLALLMVLGALLRMVAEALFGSPPQHLPKGEMGIMTVAPICVLLALLLLMGTYIPGPVVKMLNAATNIALDKGGGAAQVKPELRAIVRAAAAEIPAEEPKASPTPLREEM